MRQSIHDVDISFQSKMHQLYSAVFLLIYSINVHIDKKEQKLGNKKNVIPAYEDQNL